MKREGGFIRIVGTIVAAILLFSALIAFSLGGEYLALKWKRFIEPKRENVKREVWENTKSHVRSAVRDIGKRMREFNKAESADEKLGIANYIANQYPNLDPSAINDREIREFYKKCKYGGFDF